MTPPEKVAEASQAPTLALPRKRERENSCPAVLRLLFRRPHSLPESAIPTKPKS
ncbi:hypothetical protein HMPREF9120_00578 [Neisseria sp. oral taxon 020 str. F0370]|nr:hypothetical protein HMPREF9120_00578 [Neisseria sp. oral taxon 020 str. F0370]